MEAVEEGNTIVGKCTNYLDKKGNTKDPFDLKSNYGGIPEALVLYLLGWLALMVIFLIVRKHVFNMTRQDQPKKSGQLARETDLEAGEEAGAGQSELARRISQESGCFLGWLANTFECVFYSDERMLELAGSDAVQYLRFQIYIIAFLALLTVLSIGVILPINFQGNNYGNKSDFGHSTVINLEAGSNYLYVHKILAFLLFPVSIFFMKKFSEDLKLKDTGLAMSRTLFIKNIPEKLSTEDNMRRHLSEAYPVFRVTELSMAYEVTDLTQVTEELRDAEEAKKEAEQYQIDHGGKPLMMYPKACSRFSGLFCRCCSEKVSAVNYYTEQVTRLQKEVERLTEESLRSPLGIAFVTFDNIKCSKTFYDDHKSSYLTCFKSKPQQSSLSDDLKPERWNVSFASEPSDIMWTNLKEKKLSHYLLIALIYIGLIWIGIFFTTPEFLAHEVNHWVEIFIKNHEKFLPGSSWLLNNLPTVILMIFATLMPSVLAMSVRCIGHNYKTTESYVVLRDTFWYLWLVVLVFPTLGLTTVENLFIQFIDNNGKRVDVEWECFFNPDISAFYVDYVISAALVGTGLELVRLSEAAVYFIFLCFSSSPADVPAVKRAATEEFRFAENYARTLMMFSMVIMYSFNCPLITPFGLLFFIMKHCVDKYNLTWVYTPSKIKNNDQIHRLAIQLFIFSVVMLQLFQTLISYMRSLNSSPDFRTYLSMVLLGITLMIYPAQVFPDCCRKMSPIQYANIVLPDEEYEVTTAKYIPDVLFRALLDRERRNNEDNSNN